VGLLLGFVLRLGGREPEEIIPEALDAGLRSVVWFVSFSLLERLSWPARLRALALAAGVAGALLSLAVSDGLSLASVAGPLWLAIGLAQNSRLRPAWGWLSRRGPLQMLTLPVLAALALLFGLMVFLPMNSRYSLQQAALKKGSAYVRAWRSGDRRLEKHLISVDEILKNLSAAAQLDPGDAQLRIQVGNWYLDRWLLSLQREDAQKGIEQAIAAQHLNPQGRAGYEAEYHFHMLIARRLEEQLQRQPAAAEEDRARDRGAAQRQSQEAAQALERYLAPISNDPNDPVLQYLLAEAYFRAKNRAEGLLHARQAQELDELAADAPRPFAEGQPGEERRDRREGPTRKLTDRQRKQVRQWLEDVPAG
jgi:tetratricopeptide (TPR) repeat protein